MTFKGLSDTLELHNGTRIPVVGYGTYKTPDGEICAAGVEHAIKTGYRHIDTAEFYGNERGVGEGIRRSGIPRGELFVTTKLWNDNHGYANAIEACEKSLERLGSDYIDLYLIHWPNPAPFRDTYPEKMLDTWRAFEKLYKDGVVRTIGVSNFYIDHLKVLFSNCSVMPMADQIEMHPGLAQDEVREFARKNGMIVEAWAPLMKGRAFGDKTISDIALKHGCRESQVLLRWCMQKGAVPLPKSVHPERIEENARLFGFELDGEDMARLDAFDKVGRLGSHPDTAAF